MRFLLAVTLGAEPSIEVTGEATNGADAGAQCPNQAPDAVVLDMRMPGMTGLEAAREILLIDPAPTVIMCSAYMDAADRAEAGRIGVSACVDKTDLDQLAAVLVSAHGGG